MRKNSFLPFFHATITLQLTLSVYTYTYVCICMFKFRNAKPTFLATWILKLQVLNAPNHACVTAFLLTKVLLHSKRKDWNEWLYFKNNVLLKWSSGDNLAISMTFYVIKEAKLNCSSILKSFISSQTRLRGSSWNLEQLLHNDGRLPGLCSLPVTGFCL